MCRVWWCFVFYFCQVFSFCSCVNRPFSNICLPLAEDAPALAFYSLVNISSHHNWQEIASRSRWEVHSRSLSCRPDLADTILELDLEPVCTYWISSLHIWVKYLDITIWKLCTKWSKLDNKYSMVLVSNVPTYFTPNTKMVRWSVIY